MRTAHWFFNAEHSSSSRATGQSEAWMWKRQITSHDSITNGFVEFDGILGSIARLVIYKLPTMVCHIFPWRRKTIGVCFQPIKAINDRVNAQGGAILAFVTVAAPESARNDRYWLMPPHSSYHE